MSFSSRWNAQAAGFRFGVIWRRTAPLPVARFTGAGKDNMNEVLGILGVLVAIVSLIVQIVAMKKQK